MLCKTSKHREMPGRHATQLEHARTDSMLDADVPCPASSCDAFFARPAPPPRHPSCHALARPSAIDAPTTRKRDRLTEGKQIKQILNAEVSAVDNLIRPRGHQDIASTNVSSTLTPSVSLARSVQFQSQQSAGANLFEENPAKSFSA